MMPHERRFAMVPAVTARLHMQPGAASSIDLMDAAFPDVIFIDDVKDLVAEADAVAISPESIANDLVRPGHMFPLAAKRHGVLERPGYTEASVDIARLAGMIPAAVI